MIRILWLLSALLLPGMALAAAPCPAGFTCTPSNLRPNVVNLNRASRLQTDQNTGASVGTILGLLSSGDVAAALSQADTTSASTARAGLGLGAAALRGVGTGAGQVLGAESLGAAGGVGTLDSTGKLLSGQVPCDAGTGSVVCVGGASLVGNNRVQPDLGTASVPLRTSLAEWRSVRHWQAACDGVTDDSGHLAAAANALRGTGTRLYVPNNCRLRLAGASQVWLSGVHLKGDGVREMGTAGPGPYGQQGGTLIIDTTAASPFVVSDDWAIDGLVINWAGQTEAAAAANGGNPIAYPPLVIPHGTDQVRNWSVAGNQIQNAFDIVDLRAAAGVGHFHYSGNQEFALRYHLRLKSVGGESFVSDNQYTPQAYFFGILGAATTYLRDYATANAEALRVEGDGTTAAVASTAVEGLRMTGNYGFALRYGIHAVGGTLNLATITGTSWDQVGTAMAADSGGAIVAATVSGGTWLCQRLADPGTAAPCLSVNGGAPGSSLALSNVDIPVVAGPAIVFHDTGAGANLTVAGGRIANVGNISVGNPYVGIDFNAPLGNLTLAGFPLGTTATANRAAAQAVVVAAARTSTVTGLTLDGWNVPLVYTDTTGRHTVTGNVSVNSTAVAAQPAIAGAGAGRVIQAGNRWDIGAQRMVMYAPAGQSTGIRCIGDDPNVACVAEAQGTGAFGASNGFGQLFTATSDGAALQVAFPGLVSASGINRAQIVPMGPAPNKDFVVNATGTGGVLSKFMILGAAPSSAATLPPGFCAIVKNTTDGTRKLWCNDGGTFVSVGLS